VNIYIVLFDLAEPKRVSLRKAEGKSGTRNIHPVARPWYSIDRTPGVVIKTIFALS